MAEPRKVLVVEDNVANQKVACYLLQTIGLHSDIATTGTAALEMASTAEYSAIILDLWMPELSGLEIAEAIRSGTTGRNQNVPIIAVTACAMAGDEDKCFEAGMNDYLSKPYTKEQFIEKVLSYVA